MGSDLPRKNEVIANLKALYSKIVKGKFGFFGIWLKSVLAYRTKFYFMQFFKLNRMELEFY